MLTQNDFWEIKVLHKHGFSNRKIRKKCGFARQTIRKVILMETPPISKPRIRRKKIDDFSDFIDQFFKVKTATPTKLLNELKAIGYKGSQRSLQRYIKQKNTSVTKFKYEPQYNSGDFSKPLLNDESNLWMHKLLQGKLNIDQVFSDVDRVIPKEEVQLLLDYIIANGLRCRNKAVTLLAHIKNISNRQISSFLLLERSTSGSYILQYKESGIKEVFNVSRKEIKKYEDINYINLVFKIIHSPPGSYGFNRTSWKMDDIYLTMKKEGLPISRYGIRKIIKNAGYRFRKAKKVLTSNDPLYKEKLAEITKILKSLGPDDRFFSVDEFGPLAIKIRGGRALTAPGEERSYPQRQKSRGSLTITCALELCTNQITYFRSERKNTEEMIKLLKRIIRKYPNCKTIYFSWDAASWHASKKLYKSVEEINFAHRLNKNPEVKLAPLPSCAQFLNVIESVFSGMARAIIHNSDYVSDVECLKAVDKYLRARNHYFRKNPKRAGNKIWGDERELPVFSESNNCKDPRF